MTVIDMYNSTHTCC